MNEEKKCTATPIFHRLFMVRTPQLQTMSTQELRLRGAPTAFDEKLDAEWANELRWRMVPISKMAEWLDSGVTIYLQDLNDAKEIYRLIYEHIHAWNEYRKRSMNITKVPVKDLELLAALAAKVYPQAKQDGLFKDIAKDMSFNFGWCNVEEEVFLEKSRSDIEKSTNKPVNTNDEVMPHEEIMASLSRKRSSRY